MTGAKTKEAHTSLMLVGEHGEAIEPEHVRMSFTGHTFLTWELEEMPPQGSTVEVTLTAIVKPGAKVAQIKIGEDKDDLAWAAFVTVAVQERKRWKVIAPPPFPQDSLLGGDSGIDSVTIEGGGSKATIGRRKKASV